MKRATNPIEKRLNALAAAFSAALVLVPAAGCHARPKAPAPAAVAPATAPAGTPLEAVLGTPLGVHPESGLTITPLTVTVGTTVHHFRVEVARSDAEQEHGLMFRKAMGADEGMLFPVAPPEPKSFWMKNTVLALDIVFIGPDRRVLNIAADAIPYDLTNLNSAGPVSAVLELNAGVCARLGIKPGDQVAW